MQDYIAVKEKYARYMPHSAGRWEDFFFVAGWKINRFPFCWPWNLSRFAAKRFRKAQCPIVERLCNSLMMHGRNNGERSWDRELDISQWCYFTFVLLTPDVKFCFWSTFLNLPPGIILMIQPFKMTCRQEIDDRENCEARVRDHPSAHRREPSPGEAANQITEWSHNLCEVLRFECDWNKDVLLSNR